MPIGSVHVCSGHSSTEQLPVIQLQFFSLSIYDDDQRARFVALYRYSALLLLLLYPHEADIRLRLALLRA